LDTTFFQIYALKMKVEIYAGVSTRAQQTLLQSADVIDSRNRRYGDLAGEWTVSIEN
jgi:hypothetical protein